MSVRLYIGNLPKELDREELQSVFAEEGDSVTTKVITDRKTGKCRGFGFVTVPNDEIADQIVEKYNGFAFKDNELKIEKALPRKKGKNEKGGEAPEEESRPTQKTTKSRKKSKGGASSSNTGNQQGGATESTQPDPRWANELEKLKQMLSAQTSNS
ncbi:MAG: RNA-binding protein [Microcoleaceae cyanobacterium]